MSRFFPIIPVENMKSKGLYTPDTENLCECLVH